MADRRKRPFIWVTWLAELIAGERSCAWSGWFRAHHYASSWKPAPGRDERAPWILAHTAALIAYRDSLSSEYEVFVEDQNHFLLMGQSATLSGKPDLILRDGDRGTVVDIKTGRPRVSHVAQVMLYQYAVPLAIPEHEGVRFDGLLVYPDGQDRIPASVVDADFVQQVGALVRRLASEDAPARTPSAADCRFCPISADDCPERVEDMVAEGLTTDF